MILRNAFGVLAVVSDYRLQTMQARLCRIKMQDRSIQSIDSHIGPLVLPFQDQYLDPETFRA